MRTIYRLQYINMYACLYVLFKKLIKQCNYHLRCI